MFLHRLVSRNAALLIAFAVGGCVDSSGDELEVRGGAAAAAMSADALSSAIRTLSSDEFGGRGPSSPGEDLTLDYLTEQFASLGLQPGAAGGWLQDVPLVAITTAGAPLHVGGKDGSRALGYGGDWVGWTKRTADAAALDESELVFVGYGIVAPEFEWNDYEGVDVTGKTVVILVNDPGYATQDDNVFRGNAMTYYGRWTYKFEEAARQGARGALIVHETGAAGYPWDVVQSSWTGPQFGLVSPDGGASRVEVEGWLSGTAAADILRRAGQDLAALSAQAARPGFAAGPLGLSVSTQFTNTVVPSTSRNVVALLPGSERPDEVVLYMAHWDHFGTGPDSLADPIYNGAFDNATGTAGLIELARAFKALPEAPQRSVVFVAVTAEEQGLLGSAYYAVNPVFPTHQTVAAINLDGLNVDGPMRDITVVGYGASELDGFLQAAASEQARVLRPDPEPEKGYYYRSDHFSLAKVGVPALYTDAGLDHVEFGEAWTLERRSDYVANRYHTPADEFDPTWDFEGMLQDLALLFDVGYRIADSDVRPNWAEGNEFRSIRQADLDAHGVR